MLAHVPFFGRNARGSPDFLAYPVPKGCMHVLGTGVPRCLGVARSASSPKAAEALGQSRTPGAGSRLAGSPAWHGLPQCPGYGHWASYYCVALVFGFGFRGNPATPGWGLGWVCLGTGFGFTPTFPATACGVYGWTWVLVCAPHSWLRFWGVRGCVRAPPVPRHFWLGCAVWVCVLGLKLRRCPATPGWGVWGCACLCARSVYIPPLLAGLCGVGVCASARVLAAPRDFWLACWAVCVPGCALRLYPATPGWAVRRRCVCLSSGSGCATPLLAEVLGCVSVSVCTPLVPRHSWLGCAVLMCVLGLGFRLRPATPGWGVGVSVCLCVCSACTPPLLAGVCGVGVCIWARVLAAPCRSWLRHWGVCLFVCALRAGTPRNTERHSQQGRTKKNAGATTNRATPARRGPSGQREHRDRPQEKVRRIKRRLGSPPARPGGESHIQAHTHRTQP